MNPPLSYWLIAVFLGLWACAYAWLVTYAFILATPADYEQLVESGRILPEYRSYIEAIPAWIIVLSFFVAITRLLGAAALLMTSAWALPIYAASFVVVVIVMGRAFLIAGVAQVIEPSQIFVEAAFFAISAFAAGYAWWASKQGLFGPAGTPLP